MKDWEMIRCLKEDYRKKFKSNEQIGYHTLGVDSYCKGYKIVWYDHIKKKDTEEEVKLSDILFVNWEELKEPEEASLQGKCPCCNLDSTQQHEQYCPLHPANINERMKYEKPHKCPICNGTGSVSGGFYSRPGDVNTWSSTVSVEQCRACEGEGIIWG